MKKTVILFLSIVLSGVIAMGIAGPNKSTARAAERTTERNIEVQGTGEISAVPDMAMIHFGVETADPELAEAQSENARIMDTVMQAFDSFAIQKEQIRTGQYSVSPRYEYQNGVSKKTGYQVQNMVRVEFSDLERAGEFIDAVTRAGANVFHGIEFVLSDKSACYNDALKIALGAARQKAELIADVQGVTLGDTLKVVEQPLPDAVVIAPQARAMVAMDSGSVTPVSSGKLIVRASVTVIYAIA